MRDVFAYTFACDLAMNAIRTKLNELGPWKWGERSSDRYADYTSTIASVPPYRCEIKVLFDPDELSRTAVNVHFESNEPDATAKAAQIRARVLDVLLPGLGARDVRPADTYE